MRGEGAEKKAGGCTALSPFKKPLTATEKKNTMHVYENKKKRKRAEKTKGKG